MKKTLFLVFLFLVCLLFTGSHPQPTAVFAQDKFKTIAFAPTAAPVSVSGRVTDSRGRGVSRAQITINGSSGAVFYARSNPFGYYALKEIESGETYIFQVSHKRYIFAPQVINLTEDLNDLNFTTQP